MADGQKVSCQNAEYCVRAAHAAHAAHAATKKAPSIQMELFPTRVIVNPTSPRFDSGSDSSGELSAPVAS